MLARRNPITPVLLTMLVVTFAVTLITYERARRNQSVSLGSNPPYTNELTLDVAQPIATFQPTKTTSPVYNHVVVYTATGTKIVLQAKAQPLLFTAYWCPHCQRTLALLSKNASTLHVQPTVIAMGFAPGTTLAQAVSLEAQEIQDLHLQPFTIDYLLDPNQIRYVPEAYPTLVFPYHRGLAMISYEHTLAAWRQALNY